MQKRQNFDMSVRMVKRSLDDRERVEKIQGLLNELLAFLEDDLSIVTGSYRGPADAGRCARPGPYSVGVVEYQHANDAPSRRSAKSSCRTFS